nr:MAG TPA: hypothetical protein [Bacteriophage sp.]
MFCKQVIEEVKISLSKIFVKIENFVEETHL